MAFMSQQRKAELAPKIKEICKRYGVKASIAVNNHSTLVLNIKSGKIDFFNESNTIHSTAREYGCIQVNVYWYHEHFTGEANAFLSEVIPAMNVGNHNRSDIMSDYFDVGWYVDINIGQWNKPYQLIKE